MQRRHRRGPGFPRRPAAPPRSASRRMPRHHAPWDKGISGECTRELLDLTIFVARAFKPAMPRFIGAFFDALWKNGPTNRGIAGLKARATWGESLLRRCRGAGL